MCIQYSNSVWKSRLITLKSKLRATSFQCTFLNSNSNYQDSKKSRCEFQIRIQICIQDSEQYLFLQMLRNLLLDQFLYYLYLNIANFRDALGVRAMVRAWDLKLDKDVFCVRIDRKSTSSACMIEKKDLMLPRIFSNLDLAQRWMKIPVIFDWYDQKFVLVSPGPTGQAGRIMQQWNRNVKNSQKICAQIFQKFENHGLAARMMSCTFHLTLDFWRAVIFQDLCLRGLWDVLRVMLPRWSRRRNPYSCVCMLHILLWRFPVELLEFKFKEGKQRDRKQDEAAWWENRFRRWERERSDFIESRSRAHKKRNAGGRCCCCW